VRSEFLNQLGKGQVRKGVVSSIVNFGAFVDLGGVDGLVHVSELSWKHIDHPSEVVEVGQEVTVEVLDVDMDRERVSLSLKATQEDPWRHFARTHAIGQVVPGKVTKLVPFGAFVRVDEGITTDTEFDEVRAQYGVVDHYDDQGNFVPPEGFDVETGEWLEGFDTQREAWEKQYAEAHAVYERHLKQIAAAQAADAESAEPSNYSSDTAGAPSAQAPAGSLVNDEQLAALRERLAGN
jgi:small subunit ribosomal protein S1